MPSKQTHQLIAPLPNTLTAAWETSFEEVKKLLEVEEQKKAAKAKAKEASSSHRDEEDDEDEEGMAEEEDLKMVP